MHEIHKIVSFRNIAPYTLEVTFENSIGKIIDFQPILSGELFGPLRDIHIFEKVMIDPEVHTLVWPNGADFDPALLYNWEKHIDELTTRAKGWLE